VSEIFLLPGQLAVVKASGVVRTILGSCVAVVLYDGRGRVAGVNHFLLPGPAADGADKLRHGPDAIQALIAAVLAEGVTGRLNAAIYGGGAVVDALTRDFSIGDANIQTARRSLAGAGIPIVDEDTGGSRGRKIELALPACRVRVRYIGAA
jgi:chemotaxis protein CheD